ncbi:hypothetical protein Bbelb_270690 [Branchiostoma belcheri]|nr:hypothetical protein Bbelb_270690 [Branchiostoma belcheri]
MSGAPEVVMLSDTGQWWIWKEDGKVALVNDGDGSWEPSGMFGSKDVWLRRLLWPLRVQNGVPGMLDEGYYVTPGTGQVLYVERTTVEGSSGTEATTLAPEEADSGVAMVKRHFVGKFEIPVDRTVSPHWRRLCRHPHLKHAFLPDEIVTYTTCVGMFDIATKFPSWWTRRGKFPLGGLDSTRVSALVGLHRLRAGTPLVSAWSTSRELPSCVTWQGTPLVADLTQEHRSCRPGSGIFPRVGHHVRSPFVSAYARELPSCVTWQGTPLVTDSGLRG